MQAMFSLNKKLIPLLIIVFGALFFTRAYAATNINSTTTEHWAWNDLIGWMDFFNTNTITVASNATTTGYASSSVGDISLDCATTRGDINICSQSNYGVVSDNAGNYSGWAWNDQYGWISFWCGNNSGCGSSNYRVTIDPGGRFRNFAWNDVVGWISFDCTDNPGGCDPPNGSNYKVITSWTPTSTTGWLESSTFDTGVSAGAQLNSVLWQGNLPADTAVKFQFASSNSSSGPWTFMGTDGTSNTYYPLAGSADPNASLKINYTHHNNKRYFRYKAFLVSDPSSTLSPRVDDIIVNWSP